MYYVLGVPTAPRTMRYTQLLVRRHFYIEIKWKIVIKHLLSFPIVKAQQEMKDIIPDLYLRL